MSSQRANNYFGLLGIEVGFYVPQDVIDERYQRFQMLLHPDRYAGESDQMRRIAAQKSAHLNEAYRILSDACSRAAYILELEGLSFNSEQETVQDPAFLLNQMELREQLINAAGDIAALQAIRQNAEQKLTEHGAAFAQAYSDRNLDQARMMLVRMQFVRKLSDDALAKIKHIESS